MTPQERREWIHAYEKTPQGKRVRQRSYMKHLAKRRAYAKARYEARKAASYDKKSEL